MTDDKFKSIVERRLTACKSTLVRKASEYAPEDDRLANFKRAAALQECTSIEALGGMLAKHTIALYDFILHGASTAQWEEKITDSINYLLLLEGLLAESGFLSGGLHEQA